MIRTTVLALAVFAAPAAAQNLPPIEFDGTVTAYALVCHKRFGTMSIKDAWNLSQLSKRYGFDVDDSSQVVASGKHNERLQKQLRDADGSPNRTACVELGNALTRILRQHRLK
jgi:hypothetical protein